MAKSRLEQMLEVYVEHKITNRPVIDPREMASILRAVKEDALEDLRDEQIQQMKREVKKEAKRYKKAQFKRVRTSIIVETILVALLIGIIVNQVTTLLPSDSYAPWAIIVISLLLCVLLIWVETGKD